MKRSAKRIYDSTILQKLCKDKNIDYSKITKINKKKEDEIEIQDDKISKMTYIKGNCTNNQYRGIFCRRFDQIYEYGGKCERCTKIRTNKYTLEVLNGLHLQLSREYFREELHVHFIIEGNCKTENCMNIFSRKFGELINIHGYCQNCAIENAKEKREKHIWKFTALKIYLN